MILRWRYLPKPPKEVLWIKLILRKK
jgi:hypothetical protein